MTDDLVQALKSFSSQQSEDLNPRWTQPEDQQKS